MVKRARAPFESTSSTADPETLAALHLLGFPADAEDGPRAWSSVEFRTLLSHPSVFIRQAGPAFLLGRTVLDEAELLTLTTPPEARRRGYARNLMAEFDAAAVAAGATQGFLEVAANNLAALRLYEMTGWQRAGLRRGYYGPKTDAVVMRKSLTETPR